MSSIDCNDLMHCLHEWQDFAAGLLGFTAAIIAVWAALRSETRKEGRENKSLKRALTAEIFQFAHRAFDAHMILRARSKEVNGTTLHEIEETTRFLDPVIYPNNSNRIGALDDLAHDVVLFFARIQSIRKGVERIRRDTAGQFDAYNTASDGRLARVVFALGPGANFVGEENTKEICEQLLRCAETASTLLPQLATGTIDYRPAENFLKGVKQARADWGENKYDKASDVH